MLLEEMSDEDLIFLMKAGSKYAEQVFYKRYYKFSEALAKNYYLEFNDSGIEYEDFLAIAFSNTHLAYTRYEDVENSFNTYWSAIVKNAIYDFVNKHSYHLGARALSGISLDQSPYQDNNNCSFYDIFGEKENMINAIDIVKQQVYGDHSELNDEQKLLAHYLFFEGLKPSEIMKLTNWNRNHISYVIGATKKKIQEILKENYL